MREIRIGTRSSPLAIAQSEIVAQEIMRSWPSLKVTLVKMTTSGDRHTLPFSDSPSGIKGMFTYELEQALIRHDIDLAVHSLKDLPATMNPELPIVAYSRRADPRDALIASVIGTSSVAATERVIGTSSLRRRLQLERLYPHANIVSIRGNVNTRLKKLDEGVCSGLVLSAAGLGRLGLTERITRLFGVDELVPAPGQGILACQGRRDESYPYLEGVNDASSRDCALAERSFSRALGAGCNVPLGAFAFVEGESLTIRGLYVDESGNFREGMMTGRRSEAESIGAELAVRI